MEFGLVLGKSQECWVAAPVLAWVSSRYKSNFIIGHLGFLFFSFGPGRQMIKADRTAIMEKQ